MSAPFELPARPDLDWLKRRAKERLAELKRTNPQAQLAEAQLAVARDYGFPSWRALKARVDELRAATATPAAEPASDDVVQAFLRKVGTGDLAAVRAALGAAPQFANAVGPHPFWGGRAQALHVAIESNRPEIFELLLEYHADVNGRNDGYMHWSPLLAAVSRKRRAFIDALLARGVRVGLTEALMLGDDAALDRLLDSGGGLPAADDVPNHGTLLHFARTPHAIDRLLALGVGLDAKDHWGATPLDVLSRLGPEGAPLVAYLEARGVHASATELARLGDRARLERLRASDPQALRAPAVLRAAVDFHQYALVRWLLEAGCDVNAPLDAHRVTPLHSAAWNGDVEMVKLLVEAGADPRAIELEHDGTPLQWATAGFNMTNNPECTEVAEFLRPLTASE